MTQNVDIQHNDTQHIGLIATLSITTLYQYSYCHFFFIVMLNDIMLRIAAFSLTTLLSF